MQTYDDLDLILLLQKLISGMFVVFSFPLNGIAIVLFDFRQILSCLIFLRKKKSPISATAYSQLYRV
jgi:hypothetical protein